MGLETSISEAWHAMLQSEFTKPYFRQLSQFVEQAYATEVVYPARQNLFKAFDCCSPNQVKVVIIGQDPYHGAGQAHGLSFSVPSGVPFPPSLRNIFKEVAADCEVMLFPDSNLERWARQGVFLLNSTLTVADGKAASHQGKGWETFTDAVIGRLSEQANHLVFLLWGNSAIAKVPLIDASKHAILTAAHPSPLSAYRGFFGCKHFSKTNALLTQWGESPIDWR